MNPAKVAQNRTARLAREARTPAFSTETPAREHRMAVELEDDYGRHWTHMDESEVDTYISDMAVIGYGLSDIDHSGMCWCQE